MSLHAAQTLLGMTPTRMSQRKAVQPRQIPANASSDAAAVSPQIKTTASVSAPVAEAISAAPENTRPMLWAKRFGGPGTIFGAIDVSLGRTTRVTRRPRGENLGPAYTRAANPNARTTRLIGERNHRYSADCTTTPNPTRRAETSSTVSGNDGRRKRAMRASYRLNPTNPIRFTGFRHRSGRERIANSKGRSPGRLEGCNRSNRQISS